MNDLTTELEPFLASYPKTEFIDVFLPDAMIYTGCKNVENWTIFEEDERMKLATNHMLNMINEIRISKEVIIECTVIFFSFLI